MEDQLPLPRLQLTVETNTLPLFTTVLQSGIEIKTSRGETIAKFLDSFPGFTAEYLSDTVQTIFLNGTAVDDLTLPLTGKYPILALSAAMPGLAGAIFRRNSFHAALRTDTQSLKSSVQPKSDITVTLKLFNTIAKDRGEAFLLSGCCLQAKHLANFLDKRPQLVHNIVNIQLDGIQIHPMELSGILQGFTKVNLNIVDKNG